MQGWQKLETTLSVCSSSGRERRAKESEVYDLLSFSHSLTLGGSCAKQKKKRNCARTWLLRTNGGIQHGRWEKEEEEDKDQVCKEDYKNSQTTDPTGGPMS
jgi:hypothetical protein